MLCASGEPIRIGKNFRVDAGEKRRLRMRDAGVPSGGNSDVFGKAKKENLRKRARPVGKKNRIGRAIVHNENARNREGLFEAGRESCSEGFRAFTVDGDHYINEGIESTRGTGHWGRHR